MGAARPWARRHNRRSNCRSDGFRPVQVSLVSCGVNVAVWDKPSLWLGLGLGLELGLGLGLGP